MAMGERGGDERGKDKGKKPNRKRVRIKVLREHVCDERWRRRAETKKMRLTSGMYGYYT